MPPPAPADVGSGGQDRRADARTALATARSPLTPIPLGTWAVKPRLDILTQEQRRALRDTTGAVSPDEDQARVMPAALAAGHSDTYTDLQAQPGWAEAKPLPWKPA